MTAAAIYLRLSAKSKGNKNASNLDTQEADCRKLAEDMGATVVATFREYGESAFDRDNPDDRPAYAELCDMVRAKDIDVVIAWHTDRLWRDELEKALFIRDAQRAGLSLIVTKTARLDPQNPDDEFMLSILTAVSRKESADKSRRIKSKMAANARAGLAAGTGRNRPYGYAADRVTIVPEEAAVIREMCRRLLNGESLHSVAKWANASGARTTAGNEFDTQSIRTIATSYRHAGLRAVGKAQNAKVVAVAEWEPIVDVDTINRLRALLLDPDRRTNRVARKYLLTGLLKCGRCDQAMFAHPRYGRLDAEGNQMREYSCIAAPGRPLRCGRHNVRALELEKLIAETAIARFVDMAERGMLEQQADAVDDGIKAEIETIDAKARKLGADWAASVITDAAYYAASNGLVERRAQLSAKVRRTVSTVSPFLLGLAEHPERLAEMWASPDFTFDQRRAFLRSQIASITVAVNPPRDISVNASRVRDLVWVTPTSAKALA